MQNFVLPLRLPEECFVRKVRRPSYRFLKEKLGKERYAKLCFASALA